MTVLRNIWTDLVEKKLWPVAAVLALALVAVPVILGNRSSDTAPAPAPAQPQDAASTRAAGSDPAAAQGQVAQVSLDTTLTQGQRHRKGAVRDPFKSLHPGSGQAATTTSAATTSVPATAPATSGGTGGTGAAPSATTTTPGTTTPSTTPAAPNPLDLFRVSIRFGKAGHLTTHKDVARLTPLPSSQFPFFVYLGVLDDKKTAVFLISSDVKATGDGTCRPSKTNCQTIELQKGDTEFFDYSPTGDDQDITQFQMDILSVHRKVASSDAKATWARAHVSRKGSAVFRAAKAAKLVPQANGYRYSRTDGLLHRAKDTRAKRAAAARVPEVVIKETPWGTIVKARGAVAFAAKKAPKADHS